jgi:hypothetical protein
LRDASLLDHLVGSGQQRFRDGEAERLGCFEVYDKLDFCHLLDREIAWFITFESAPGIDANLIPKWAEIVRAAGVRLD